MLDALRRRFFAGGSRVDLIARQRARLGIDRERRLAIGERPGVDRCDLEG